MKDCIHLSREGHRNLGRAAAECIEEILKNLSFMKDSMGDSRWKNGRELFYWGFYFFWQR